MSQEINQTEETVEKIEKKPSATNSNNQTKKIQTALVNKGYDYVTVDGVIGPVTKNAIKRFQATKRIKVDGVVGEKTKKWLFEE